MILEYRHSTLQSSFLRRDSQHFYRLKTKYDDDELISSFNAQQLIQHIYCKKFQEPAGRGK